MFAANVKCRDVLQRLDQQAGGVGGIQEDQVELLAALQIGHGVAAAHDGAVRQAADLQILADQLHGVIALVDEHALPRAAAQCLNAQLARSGEQIQHPASLDIELDDGEQALLHLAGGGAGLHALQLLQSAAPGRSGDDSHFSVPLGSKRSKMTSAPASSAASMSARLRMVQLNSWAPYRARHSFRDRLPLSSNR